MIVVFIFIFFLNMKYVSDAQEMKRENEISLSLFFKYGLVYIIYYIWTKILGQHLTITPTGTLDSKYIYIIMSWSVLCSYNSFHSSGKAF